MVQPRLNSWLLNMGQFRQQARDKGCLVWFWVLEGKIEIHIYTLIRKKAIFECWTDPLNDINRFQLTWPFWHVLHLWAHLRLGLSLLLTLCSHIIEHTILVCILIPACFFSFAVFLKNALLLIYWHNCTNYICEVSYQHILVQWTDLSLSLIILNRKLLNFFFAIFKTSVLTLILFIKMFLSEFCFERDTR